MRAFLIQLLLFFLLLFTVSAQYTDTVYLSRTLQKVNAEQEAAYFKVTTYTDALKTEGTEKTFLITGEKSSENGFIVDKSNDFERREYAGLYTSWHKNGQMEMQVNYLAGKKEGEETRWYENGQIHNISHYTAGNKQGAAISYYPDGKVKRQEVFANDLLTIGKCFTKTGADTVYFPMEEIPVFPGGEIALNNFIKNNLKYNRKALRQGVKGLVVVQFVVDKAGIVKDPEVVKKVSPELDAECIRIVNLMPPNWKPARQEGRPVNFRFSLPIRFSF